MLARRYWFPRFFASPSPGHQPTRPDGLGRQFPGRFTTVNVAMELVTEPAALLTTSAQFPASVHCTLEITKMLLVAPLIRLLLARLTPLKSH